MPSLEFPTTGDPPVAALCAALDEQIADGAPGAILAVDGPDRHLRVRLARGRFDRASERPLDPADGFRAASVTKAVTAAAAVRLAELDAWSLDDPVADHLPADVVAGLARLTAPHHVGALTLRRLLAHTSGVPDYFFDERFQAQVARQPDRTWRPRELVDAALEAGSLGFPPGSDFRYGDTGYVLAGLAIESVSDQPLAAAYRSLIFEPVGMTSTYLEWHEPPLDVSLSHHYDGPDDLTGRNTSYDWAGGGLVTTADDLVRFLHGLYDGRLLGERGRTEMTTWNESVRWRPRSSARYLSYGLGLGVNRAYGHDLVGATGVWGAFAYYWPAASTAITGTVNVVGADRAALLDAVVAALERHCVVPG